jgi:hypothetical protein
MNKFILSDVKTEKKVIFFKKGAVDKLIAEPYFNNAFNYYLC